LVAVVVRVVLIIFQVKRSAQINLLQLVLVVLLVQVVMA
jgi:hypothetical protein